jgi:hypothetical protein
MRGKTAIFAASLLGIAMLVAGFPDEMRAQQPIVQRAAAPVIDDDDIGGVVTSRFGPEAGVWVIAETTELGTRFAKMAVTDERGRFVVPITVSSVSATMVRRISSKVGGLRTSSMPLARITRSRARFVGTSVNASSPFAQPAVDRAQRQQTAGSLNWEQRTI